MGNRRALLVGMFYMVGLLGGAAGQQVRVSSDTDGPAHPNLLEKMAQEQKVLAYEYALANCEATGCGEEVHSIASGKCFRVGSLGKIIVAMGILVLQEQQQLDLVDPVGRYLPEVSAANPWEKTDPVRIVHLLEHTAGLDEMHFNEYFSGDEGGISLEAALQRNAASKRIRWRPGTRSAYSNVGYAIAARIIEVVTNQEPDVWLRENVLLKMGMDHSFFDRGRPEMQSKILAVEDLAPYRTYLYYPAVGFVSNAADMVRLLRFLIGEGNYEGDTLLEPASVRRMWSSETTVGAGRGWMNGDYGLGFRIWADSAQFGVLATGMVDGFRASMAIFPRLGRGRVLMTATSRPAAAFEQTAAAKLDQGLGLPELHIRPGLPVQLPVEGHYRYESNRNALFDFETEIVDDLSVTWIRDGENGHFEGRLWGQDVFQLEIRPHDWLQAPHAEHCLGFAGKSVDGNPYLVVDGRYFELRQGIGFQFLQWAWWVYKRMAYLLTGFAAVVLWMAWKGKRWAQGYGRLAVAVILPYWIAAIGYWMLVSERYWALGRFSAFSCVLALLSILLPLASLYAVRMFVRRLPQGALSGLRWCFLPIVLGNLGMVVYLGVYGLIPFFSWRY